MPRQNRSANGRAQQNNSADACAVTPKELAYEFNMDEREVRAFLRLTFPRTKQAYWRLTPEQAEHVRALLGGGR